MKTSLLSLLLAVSLFCAAHEGGNSQLKAAQAKSVTLVLCGRRKKRVRKLHFHALM